MVEYIHPKKYKGLKYYDSELKQIRQRAIVEKYCLFCEDFMGQEHDFENCWGRNKWGVKTLCTKGCSLAVPIDEQTLRNSVKCKVKE